MPKQHPKSITVGELREHLQNYPDDWELTFGAPVLEFYRVKARGKSIVAIEFNDSFTLDDEDDGGE